MGSTYEYKAMGSISPLNLIRGFITYPMQNLGGIQHNEAAFGIGRVAIIVLILSITNKGVTLFECLFLISLYLMMGKYVKAPILFRCPVKWAYLMTVSAAFIIAHMSIHIPLALVLIQMLDILLNHRRLLLDNSQWAVWPEQVYSSPLVRYLEENVNGHKVSGLPFPLRSGYITGIRGIGYLGGSSTKERAKLFGTGGEGSPCHDWFYMKEDGNCLNRYGIKFAYRPMKKLNPWKWSKTPIRGLWLNRFLIPHN